MSFTHDDIPEYIYLSTMAMPDDEVSNNDQKVTGDASNVSNETINTIEEPENTCVYHPVGSIAELVRKAENRCYRIKRHLATPQKFRVRIKMNNSILGRLKAINGVDCYLSRVSNTINALGLILFLLCESIYMTMIAKGIQTEDEYREFVHKNIRYYMINGGDADAVEFELILQNYLFVDVDRVKGFLVDVFALFQEESLTSMRYVYLRETMFDIVDMSIYSEDPTAYITKSPVKRSWREEFPTTGSFDLGTSVEFQYPIHDKKMSQEEITLQRVKGELWELPKADSAGCVLVAPDMNCRTPEHVFTLRYWERMDRLRISKKVLEPKKKESPSQTRMYASAKPVIKKLIMRFYGVRKMSDAPLMPVRTGKPGVWKLVNSHGSWDCHICDRKHTESTFMTISKNRAYIGCMKMPKGSRTRYIGCIEDYNGSKIDISAKDLIIKDKIALLVAALLERVNKSKKGGRPFDIMMSSTPGLWFLNAWKEWRCPLCNETHTDSAMISVSDDGGAVFFKYRHEDGIMGTMLIGQLINREEKRLAWLSVKKHTEDFIMYGTDFPGEMKEFYERIYRKEDHKITVKKENNQYVSAVTVSADEKDATIMQSPCGSAKTYQVCRMLMRDRLRMKRDWYTMCVQQKETAKQQMIWRSENRESLSEKEQIEYMNETLTRFFFFQHKTDSPEPESVFDTHKKQFDMIESDEYYPEEVLDGLLDLLNSIYCDIEPSVLWLSCRRTYGRSFHRQYEKFMPGLELYLELNGNLDCPRLINSIESLTRCVHKAPFDYVVLDEFTTVFEQLYSNHIDTKQATRNMLDKLASECEHLICMDADISSEGLYHVGRWRECNIEVRINEYKPRVGHRAIYCEKIENIYLEIRKCLMRSGNAHVVCTVKREAHKIAMMFEDYEVLLVTSETTGVETNTIFGDINTKIHVYRVLIHTSTLSVGVDISTAWSETTFVIGDARTVDSRCIKQMINRIRINKSKIVFYHVRKYKSDKYLDFQTIYTDLKQRFGDSNEVRRLVYKSAISSDLDTEKIFNLSNPWVVSYLYRCQTENLKLMCLREMVDYRLMGEGYALESYSKDRVGYDGTDGDYGDGEDSRDDSADVDDAGADNTPGSNVDADSAPRAHDGDTDDEMKDQSKVIAEKVKETLIESFRSSYWLDLEGVSEEKMKELNRVNGVETRSRRAAFYKELEGKIKDGAFNNEERWIHRKSKLLMHMKPEYRARFCDNGEKLYELEKYRFTCARMKRMRKTVGELVEWGLSEFEQKETIDTYLNDDNLKLAVVVYICQLLGLRSPMEEREVTRASERVPDSKRAGMKEDELRIAEGSLERCVDWLTLHQKFVSGVFGRKWKQDINTLKGSVLNRELQYIFKHGVNNRLNFNVKKQIKGERVKLIKNTCKLNKQSEYFI